MDPLDHLFHKDRNPLSSRSILSAAWTHLSSNLGSLPRKVNKAQLFTRGTAAVSWLESFEAIFFSLIEERDPLTVETQSACTPEFNYPALPLATECPAVRKREMG